MYFDRCGARARRSSIRLIATALLLTTCLAGGASAATFNVTDQASYDAAVTAANSSAGPHVINITAAGSYLQNVNATFNGTISINTAGATLTGTGTNQYNTSLQIAVVSGATFSTGAFLQTIGSLSGAGTLDTDSASGLLITGADNTNTAFSGTIIKTGGQFGALLKTGTGTFTINGAQMAQGEFYATQGTIANTAGSTSIKYFALGTGTGNSSTMTMSGGTLNITGTFAGGPPCASSCPALQVGDFGGTGIFNQTAGTVIVGAAGVAGSMNIGNQGGNGTYNLSGGTLQLGVFGDVNSAGLYSIGRQATSNPSFANSTGLLNLSGTGVLDVQAGELIIGDRDAGGAAGAVTSSTLTMTGGTLRVRSGANLWLSAFDNGNATDSTFNLNGGTLEIGDGRLQAGYGGGTGTYVFNMGTATIKVIDADLVTSVHGTLNGATAAAGTTIDTNGFNATWNGVLDGTGWLVKTGAGTLKLEAVNTYTGGTGIYGGTVFVDSLTDLGALTSGLSFNNGGILQLGVNGALSGRGGSTTTMAGAGTIDTNGFSSTFDSNISGGGALTKIGAGTLDLGGNNNAHTGALNINAGQVNAFDGNAIGNTSAVTVASGATLLFYGAGNETIGSLAGAGSLLLNGRTVTTGGNNSSTTWTGTTDASAGGLTKVGTGTMTVNANLSYTGLTTVNGGTLLVNGTAADSVVVNSGGTFGGNATINGNLTLNAGGHLAPGNSPGIDHVVGNYIGGGIFDAEVQFNNAGAPVNGTTHDFLQVDGNVSGTTSINVLAFAPSGAPAATTGNGIQLVQVGGNVSSSAFQLAGPVLQGGYEYLLNYLQDYSGTLDGFFLQSVTRDELWGHAAMLTAGQVMTDACFRGPDRQAAADDRRFARAWATVTGGSRNMGADTGVESDQDFFCGSGGIDAKMSDSMRMGISGGYGNSSVDVVTPSGLGNLDGNQGAIEVYASWAKRHWFMNVSAGYSTTDWTFNSPLTGSSEATVDGFIASVQGGARFGMGPVRFGVLAELDYDGTKCGETCFVTGTEEEISQVRAKAAARLDGNFSNGEIQPFVQVSIQDNLDGANSAGIGAARIESEAGLTLGADAGITAFVSKGVAIFASGGITSGQDKDVDGYQAQGGVKIHW